VRHDVAFLYVITVSYANRQSLGVSPPVS